jgi:hypothetical protein
VILPAIIIGGALIFFVLMGPQIQSRIFRSEGTAERPTNAAPALSTEGEIISPEVLLNGVDGSATNLTKPLPPSK